MSEPISLRYDLDELDCAKAVYDRDGYKVEIPRDEALGMQGVAQLPRCVWVRLDESIPGEEER